MSLATSASSPLSPVRIAVDCMGGDHGPSITLPACQAFLARHPDAELLLVGLPEGKRALAPLLREAIASGEVKVPEGDDPKAEKKMMLSVASRPVDTDPSTFFGNPDASPVDATVDALDAVIEHAFSDDLSLRNHLRWADYDKFYQNVFPGAADAAVPGRRCMIMSSRHVTQCINHALLAAMSRLVGSGRLATEKSLRTSTPRHRATASSAQSQAALRRNPGYASAATRPSGA